MDRNNLLCTVWLAALVVGGCTVGPDYKSPEASVPGKWAAATTAPATTQTSRTVHRPAELADWWKGFGDPTLDSLVARAVESNLSLQQASARIRQARASRAVTAGGQWPVLAADGSYRHSRTPGAGPAAAPTQDSYQVGLDASWELDLFGGVRRGIEAADAELAASVEDHRDVLVTVLAEVAVTYLDLRAFQQQVAIAKQNLGTQQRSAGLTRKRFDGGFASRLDVVNAEAQVASTMSEIPLLEASADQAIYALGVLLGREPTALSQELSPPAAIPAVPPQIPVGLPADLLSRRPDIRRAQAQLHAAIARIGVATADLYPQLGLTGSLSFSGDSLSSAANWASRAYSLGAGIHWPILQGGKINANIEVQKALADQSLLAYRSTVLVALREVQSALAAYAREQEHRQSLIQAVTSNRRAVQLATQLYQEGQTEFLNVLSAQRSLYASESALVQSTRNVSTNLVALYKALGGGWADGSRAAGDQTK